MPTRRTSKSSFSSTSMFRRSEDFLMQKREKTLEMRKLALREKEMKEMENCSFNPKIHSDAYLKTKKIHVSSRESSKRYLTAQTSPVTPSKGLEGKNHNKIGSGEYLELEFYEEQEKSVGRGLQPTKGLFASSKKDRTDHSKARRSATPKRSSSVTRVPAIREFKTPNPKNSKSQLNWRPIKAEENKRRLASPTLPLRKSKDSFFKRSIVVLNEHDEFEDLESYLAKTK